jgi:hypothetical protein
MEEKEGDDLTTPSPRRRKRDRFSGRNHYWAFCCSSDTRYLVIDDPTLLIGTDCPLLDEEGQWRFQN